jgi:acyl-CoA synthetase (AMP-forming)/AMP-acid ligase II
MAEATLAVTLTDPAEMWATSMGPEPMADGKRPVKRRRVVGVGRPVRNMEISVGSVDGEIKIKGPSLMEGYVGKAPWVVGKSEWFPTKDTGFLEGENLFVLGRTDEVCFVAGRNIHLRDIEESLHRLAGLRAGRVAVAKVSEGEYGIVAEVEDLEISKDATKTLANDVRRVALGRTNKAPIWVALIPRGTLPITTSGKPRPAEAVAALRSGKLDPLPGSLAESWV